MGSEVMVGPHIDDDLIFESIQIYRELIVQIMVYKDT